MITKEDIKALLLRSNAAVERAMVVLNNPKKPKPRRSGPQSKKSGGSHS
jgi:hypothetical protein